MFMLKMIYLFKNKIMLDLLDKISWIVSCHDDTNHKYDNLRYIVHLKRVVDYVTKYIHHIPPQWHEIITLAAWGHDLIEDTRVSYNDVKEKLGEQVADIIYALTNEKGKTRKERAGDKYYTEMKLVKYAPFIKICDRLANASYSKENGDSMLNRYKEEHIVFMEIFEEYYEYQDMFNELNQLFA